MGSNPTEGMDVCTVLSCVGSGLATGLSPVQGVLPSVCKIHNFKINFEWEETRVPNPPKNNNGRLTL
jgi:hypothetical protein